MEVELEVEVERERQRESIPWVLYSPICLAVHRGVPPGK